MFSKNLLQKIEEIKIEQEKVGTPVDEVVIGSDVNASPEKLKSRFKLFTDESYKVKRTGSPTNVHFQDTSDKVREIDYFFSRTIAKSSLIGRLKHFFTRHDKIKVSASSFSRFGFDMKNNMSDHKPILGKVEVKEGVSLFDKVKEKLGFRKITPSDPKSFLQSISKHTAIIDFDSQGGFSKLDITDWSAIEVKECLLIIEILREQIEKGIVSNDDDVRMKCLDLSLALVNNLCISLKDFLEPKNKAAALKGLMSDFVSVLIKNYDEALKMHNIETLKAYSPEKEIPLYAPSSRMDENMPDAISYLKNAIKGLTSEQESV